MNYMIEVFILFFALFGINSATKGDKCEKWDLINDDKCYKLLDSQTLDYENSVKACKKLSIDATLVSIESKDEQKLLEEFLFQNKSIVESVWMGAQKVAKDFVWDSDGSKFAFNNWDQKNAIKDNFDCVEMETDISDSTKSGKWLSMPCKKRNIALCQLWTDSNTNGSDTQLEKKFNDLKKSVNEFMTEMTKFRQTAMEYMSQSELNLIPIGFMYFQLPHQKGPSDLWPVFKWKEISQDYSGLFFRVLGGNSSAFESVQDYNAPMITEVEEKDSSCNTYIHNIKADSWSNYIQAGVSGSNALKSCIRFLTSAGEVRPKNTAIRVWTRTK